MTQYDNDSAEVDRLNREVTGAICRAESGLRVAIAYWEVAEAAETAILNSEDDHFLETDRTIASRGVGMARMRITVLKALLEKD
jgi:hypothetical protein